ncbi:MAG: fused MFS/spermidine synthase [Firmicutes bacterium]|nr:fused MFS/spermidine synthase [Bacillota bacterium]
METQKQYNILKSKAYLYLTEFFSGMAIMAVELGASRLLAPYFSSSQIVWTIIIATIMIAMAAGNVYGGRSADKRPDPDILYRRLLIAAVWIAAIPLLGKYMILLISGALIITISHNLLVIAAFAACMIIFVFPCFLLGTVTPSLVKYTVGSLEESGTTVGMLGAFNTIGSIIGTFLPTFVTIPAVGTAITFLIFSGILLILALIYFISCRRRKLACIVCSIAFCICAVFGNASHFAFWESDLTYEGESIYNYLQVRETDQQVILSTNVLFGVQSLLEKQDQLTGMYYDYAMAAPVMAAANQPLQDKEPLKVLVLGMGSGTYDHQCRAYFDNLDIEGVEIDEKITDLAHEYFQLPRDAKVTTYDGRAYLMATDQKYDVIMVDAYQDITIPFQMSSKEFFSETREHLTENGVMVVNMNLRSDAEDGINAWLSDTIASVYPYVQTVDVKNNTNRILFASMQRLEQASYRQALEEIATADPVKRARLRAFLGQIPGQLTAYEGQGHILTDDRAPVEVLSMRAIDQVIAEELAAYKEMYREEGLQGVLEDVL